MTAADSASADLKRLQLQQLLSVFCKVAAATKFDYIFRTCNTLSEPIKTLVVFSLCLPSNYFAFLLVIDKVKLEKPKVIVSDILSLDAICEL